MSGHSKWSTIKHKKGAADAKRGKIFTQLIREITAAARLGGPSPDANSRLRMAIDKARGQNMPKDNIERAIKKGTGDLDGESYEEVRYEGYGPGGVALIVETLTDNRNRTVSEVRHLLAKFNGNLGATGCVAFLFEGRGVLAYPRGQVDVDALMEVAIEASAVDVLEGSEEIEVQTLPEEFLATRSTLEAKGFVASSAEISMVPQSTVTLTGQDAKTLLKLLDALEDHEDVKQVWSNFDISDEELMEAAGAN